MTEIKDARGYNIIHPDEKSFGTSEGGSVGEIVRGFDGIEFLCVGCNKPIMIKALKKGSSLIRIHVHDSPISGYPHEGGEADATGQKWWLYVVCPNSRRVVEYIAPHEETSDFIMCNHATSIWKIPNQIKRLERSLIP